MKLHGIFAPLTATFNADGSLSLDRLRENLARYDRTRLAGYVLNGSTGESVLLRWEEVYRIWETAREAAIPAKILIAGTGAESTAETIEHTQRAAALGFSAALVRTPSFYKPVTSPELLAEHYLRVADASRIPVLIYSVPVFTHVTVEAPLVARLARHPNIVGMKDSSGNVEGVAAIIAAAPKDFQTLVGSSGTLYPSLAAGAVGAILALACAFPDLCCDIYDAFRAGDSSRAAVLAERLQNPSKLLGQTYGISGLKYALDLLGSYGGPARPPLLPLSSSARHEIAAMLEGMTAGAALGSGSSTNSAVASSVPRSAGATNPNS
ncbi:MAG: dihydrodipicolinate synthase family protein [Candidatus Acidiferrales bacterium]